MALGGLAGAVLESLLWWCIDQLSYHPGQGAELGLAPPKILYNLQMVEMCVRARPAHPKLQDLHDTGQQQDNQEESW